MIDDLIENHPREREFIFDRSKQHARDVCDIAQQRARGGSRDLSHDLGTNTSDKTSSTLVPSSTLLGDEGSLLLWESISPQTSHEDPFYPDPLNLVVSGMVDGMYANTEQSSAFSGLSNVLTHSSDRFQVDRSGDRAEIVSYQHQDGSGSMATDDVDTVAPAALYLESREEVRHSNAELPAQYFQNQPAVPSISSPVEPGDPFSRKRRKQGHGSTQHLDNLYFGTGSSDSIRQLRDIVTTTRGSNSWTLSQRPSNIAETLHVLDTLDDFQQAALFVRRTYLLKLWKLRKELMDNAMNQRPAEIQPVLAVGKLESNVLDHLMAEAYPDIAQRPREAGDVRKWRKLNEVKRKSLKNRFQAAKNWNALSERFSPGILALVPSGGEFHIQNQK